MSNKSEGIIRKWMLEFFAIGENEYGHAPERLRMKVRLKNGDKLRVHRTPLHDSGSGDVEVELIRKSERSP